MFPTQLSGAYWLETPVMEHETGCRCSGTREPQPELRDRWVPDVRTVMLCIEGATVIFGEQPPGPEAWPAPQAADAGGIASSRGMSWVTSCRFPLVRVTASALRARLRCATTP